MILMSNGADGNNNNYNDTTIWTTWEELLLAFAVKRHGLNDWETVAMELQNRHRSSSVFTPENCRDKYKNLRRRFENHKNAAASGGGSDSDNDRDRVDGDNGFGESFAWLEELRKLRVAELKQEVQRYDLSIESLQMKAKTLEVERKSSNEISSVNIPDLDDKQLKEERSENDKTTGQVGVTTGKTVTVSCEDENRSCHESNSTENRQAGLKVEPELEGIKPDPESLNPVEDEEDSCDDSSDRHEMIGKESQEVMNDEDDSAEELHDSAEESKEGSQGTKESSDVQSSASLMTRKCGDGELDGGGGGGGTNPSNTVGIKRERRAAVELEPLRGVLDNIWLQKHGSMFDHRLESQKTERYKKMIRQHVDLETVQSRIEDGSYSSCRAKFYVDLLLLVNNANVFFPKSSPESFAAHELRRLVMKELKNSSAAPPPRPQTKLDPGKSDTLLAKHKSTTPLIVCKKRSSVSGKASSSGNKAEEQDEEDRPCSIPKTRVKSPLNTSNEEDDGPSKFKVKEKPVTTGVRSMRRGSSSSKGRGSVSSSQSGPPNAAVGAIQKPMPPLDNTVKAEASKVDKKKGAQVVVASSTVKKKGAADFLKRIKKNEPAGKGVSSAESVKYPGDSSTSKVKMDNKDHHPIKKSEEKKDVRRNGGGGNSGNKNVKEDISPSKRIGRPPKKGKEGVVTTGKRGREGEGEGSSSKQPKKKSRR